MTRKCFLIVALILSLALIVNPISTKALDSEKIIMRLANEEESETDDGDSRANAPGTYGDGSGGGGGDATISNDCSGFLSEDAVQLCQQILSIFRVLAPALVIIYSAIDFTHAVLGKYDGKEDALETAKIKVNKRILACVILIFIPTILKIVLAKLPNQYIIPDACLKKIT